MIPVDDMVRVSQQALASGLRLLQGHRLYHTDHGHVFRLLQFMNPDPDTHWLDIGCGFGEAALLMNDIRPDLKFTLLNNSGFQLDYCPQRYTRIYGDMQAIPQPDATFDGCMFLYSLCHAEIPEKALREAARVTKPGGALFVYDYERLEGDNHLSYQRLYMAAFEFETLRTIAEAAGWSMTERVNPAGDDTLFRTLYNNDAEYTRIFRELRPVLWKAVRV